MCFYRVFTLKVISSSSSSSIVVVGATAAADQFMGQHDTGLLMHDTLGASIMVLCSVLVCYLYTVEKLSGVIVRNT